MGRRPPALSAIEAEFELHLKQQGKAANTIKYFRSYIRRFLKHVGDLPLQRVSEQQVSEFFTQEFAHKKSGKVAAAVAISRFIQFALAKLPAPVVITDRGSEMAPARVQSEKELQLRRQWAADKAAEQKDTGENVIATLARQVIDGFLYFQSRLNEQGSPESIDELMRLRDNCQELIQNHLALFMSLSAQGRNLHPVFNERQKP